jgi:hypothetical protein
MFGKQKTLELKITFDESTGQVNISGPIANALLCYGMLKCAEHAVKEFNDQKPATRADILVPKNGVGLQPV